MTTSRKFAFGYRVWDLRGKELMDFLPKIHVCSPDLAILTSWETFFKRKDVPFIVEEVKVNNAKRHPMRLRLWKEVRIKVDGGGEYVSGGLLLDVLRIGGRNDE